MANGVRAGRDLTWAPLVLAALGFGIFELVCIAEVQPPPLWTGYLYAPFGWLYAGAGLLAMRRRPTNRIGVLLALTGLVFIVSELPVTELPVLTELGLLTLTLPLGMIAHLLHAFPSGRLVGGPERAVVALTYVATVVLVAPGAWLLTGQGTLSVGSAPGLNDFLTPFNGIVYSSLCLASGLVLAHRLVRLPPARRRVVLPLYLYGLVAQVTLTFAVNVLPRLTPVPYTTIELIQLLAAAGIPVAFVVTLVRGGWARTARTEELTTQLGTADGVAEAALQRALGDASVRFHEQAPARLGRDRGLLPLAVGGNALGAIEYDATQLTDPGALQAAGTLVAVARERARLLDEVGAARDALQGASERMVQAADRERSRIARDLHDGLQVRLVLLALRADATDPALRGELTAAVDELRAFVQGVMPAALIERGLPDAIEDLTDRLPLACDVDVDPETGRLPSAVQSTAYFVVAEALSNAIKHAGASQVDVAVRRVNGHVEVVVADDGVGGAGVGAGGVSGMGLLGLDDRLGALGGALRVTSPPGGGTRLEAEVPCGS